MRKPPSSFWAFVVLLVAAVRLAALTLLPPSAPVSNKYPANSINDSALSSNVPLLDHSNFFTAGNTFPNGIFTNTGPQGYGIFTSSGIQMAAGQLQVTGNVAVNVNTAALPLDVSGTPVDLLGVGAGQIARFVGNVAGSSGTVSIVVGNNGATGILITSPTASAIVALLNGACGKTGGGNQECAGVGTVNNQTVFTDDGKVGIGNTNPTYSLDVTGALRSTATFTTGATTTSTTTITGYAQFQSLTRAQLTALAPTAVGQVYYDSTDKKMVVSTATSAGNFATISGTGF